MTGTTISGVGPDAPPYTITARRKQSTTPYRDLIDVSVHVAEITGCGAAKYGADNWRKLDIIQISRYSTYARSRVTTGDHLAHTFCRYMFPGAG